MPESLSAVPRVDMTRIGAAVIFFISTFLPVVGVTVKGVGGFSVSASISAWHSYAVLGVLLVFAAIAIWAVQRFTAVVLPTTRVSWDVAIPALAGVGTAIIVIRGLTWTGSGIGLRYGFFLLLISGVAFAVLTYKRNASTV